MASELKLGQVLGASRATLLLGANPRSPRVKKSCQPEVYVLAAEGFLCPFVLERLPKNNKIQHAVSHEAPVTPCLVQLPWQKRLLQAMSTRPEDYGSESMYLGQQQIGKIPWLGRVLQEVWLFKGIWIPQNMGHPFALAFTVG